MKSSIHEILHRLPENIDPRQITPRRGARNPEISVNPEQDVLRGASRGK